MMVFSVLQLTDDITSVVSLRERREGKKGKRGEEVAKSYKIQPLLSKRVTAEKLIMYFQENFIVNSFSTRLGCTHFC